MMLQLVLAAAVVAGAVPVPLGHGAADAVVAGVADPEAAVVGAAEPAAVAVGAVEPEAAAVGAAEPDAAVVGAAAPEAAVVAAAEPDPAAAGAAAPEAAAAGAAEPEAVDDADAADEAQLASAELLKCEVKPWLKARTAPITTASATGMLMATAQRRLAWLSCRRRHADRCLLGIQSTSMP
jgi:hypothetical protein